MRDKDDVLGSPLRSGMLRSMGRPAGYWSRKASFSERHRITTVQKLFVYAVIIMVAIEIIYRLTY